jgi:hypothetical protein
MRADITPDSVTLVALARQLELLLETKPLHDDRS